MAIVCNYIKNQYLCIRNNTHGMSVWNSIKTLFNRETNSGATPGATPRTGAVPLFADPSATALNVATVFRCVDLLSKSVANLPLRTLTHRKGIFTPDTDPSLAYLLNVQPTPGYNGFEFWRQAVWNMLTHGNAYIVPFYNPATMALDRLALCGVGTVSHDTTADTYTVSDSVNGIFGTFSEGEIIHLRQLTAPDGKRGLSVLAFARMTTTIATAGDRETRKRIESGGDIKGIVSNGTSTHGFGEHADAQLRSLASDLARRFESGENIVALPGQVGWVQLAMSSADMQFLESRKFTVREICRFFGVHPSFVFDDTSNNYKSAEQANGAFLSHTLSPLLRCIEAELHRKLIPPALAHKRRILFDRSALLTCDMASVLAYRAGMLQTGSTINEVRRMENLPPVQGGDVAMLSANLRTVTELATQAAAASPANPASTNPPTSPTTPLSNGEEE